MRKLIIPLLLAAPLFGTAQDTTMTTTTIAVDSVPQPTINMKSDWDPKKVYRLHYPVDIPLTAAGTGFTLYAFTQIYSKDRSSEEKILSLDRNNIPKIDRHGTTIYQEDAIKAADMIFYSSMPLPALLMFDKRIRKDAYKTAFLYLEAMAVTGVLYTTSNLLNNRYRPYAYNPNVEMATRQRGGAKNSFFAGHVALVGTSTFFMAKMLNDHHPEWKAKWVPFALAGGITATMGYLRYRGGQHFITDITVGTAVGALSGILIPHFHKNKNVENRKLSFTAGYNMNTPVFGMVYKIQ